ncbi:MAG: Ig-like domain-containing protein [Thaumarchaeota archaeon]|nr:Ig-like domain-containing protein [Nitrososphaerota archaeon]
MTSLLPYVIAVTLAVGALVASAPSAHATPPEIPCDYECMWPVGTYSIPERVAAGMEFEVSWSYSWDPHGAMAATKTEGAPDGYYAVSGAAKGSAPPPGYAGSVVTLRLPQELEVVDWEKGGLKRERLWTDYYGHTIFEYTGTNAYTSSGWHDKTITVRFASEGMLYPVTKLAIDLGLSVADSPPTVLFATRDMTGASLSAEPPDAVGALGATDEYPHRQSLMWPEPIVEAAGIPTGVVGAAGDGETYVYGYLQYNDRGGVSRGAAGVLACVYDVGASAGELTPLRVGGACEQTAGDGFYGIAVPRADPNGDGDADILVRFTTESEVVTTRTGRSDTGVFEPTYLYDQRGPGGSLGATLAMGRATVSDVAPFRDALVVHVEIWNAWQYFADMFDHDVPHVTVVDNRSFGGRYSGLGRVIEMGVDPASGVLYRDQVALHEYGHHIMYTHTGRLPLTGGCSGHNYFTRTTNLCAWVEGWAGVFPSLVYGDPNTQLYPLDVHDHELGDGRGFELSSPSPRGSDAEVTVAAILWDIYDGRDPQEPADDIDSGAQLLWDILGDAPEQGEVWPALSVHDFADDWKDAGYPSLDGVLEHNGVHAHGGVTMHVLHGSGAVKTGDGTTLATAGQVVRVIASAQDDKRPSISFYGGAAAPMRQSGGDRWAGDYTVTPDAPNGPVRFAVSAGGVVTHTLHDVSPSSRTTVDRTPPAKPSAEFTAPGTIALTFRESLAPLEGATFAVSPPSGNAPAVSASLDGRTVLLSLDPSASARGQWRVSIPTSVTDLAGNAYAGDPATASFSPDSDPPTFSAKRAGAKSVSVEFNEDIRPTGRQALRSYFMLEDPSVPESAVHPRVVLTDYPNRRITLLFSQDVFAGTLTFSDVGDSAPLEDMLGNKLADESSATVTSDVAPVFSTDYREAPERVVVVWGVNIAGTTSVSEWKVNGERPVGFGTRPGVETVTVGGRSLSLFVDGLVCAGGRIQVEYARPDGSDASFLTTVGGTAVESMSASDNCGRISTTSARFLDSRTISLELDRDAQDFLERFDVAGLGETIEFVEPGSKTIILYTSSAAEANTTYVVRNSRLGIAGDYASGPLLEPVTYMDTTPPTIRYAEVDAVRNRVAIHLSEPLDAGTFSGKVFTSPTLGTITASYVTHERTIVIGHSGSVGSGPHTISVPAGIADVNGVPLETQVVTATARPETTLGTARFVDGHTLSLEASAELSSETLNRFTISPGLGSIAATQAGNVVTLSTEGHARHNTVYMVAPPFLSLDANGGNVRYQVLEATYVDGVAPSVIGARFVSPQAIEVSLSEPLDPTSLAGASFGVVPTLGAPAADYSSGDTAITVRTPEAARPGTEYTLVVPGMARDSAGLPVSTLRVPVMGVGTFLGGAAFASPNKVVLEANAPLDSSTVAEIEVLGLGRSVASYDPASRSVELRTAKAATDGAKHKILVPASVLDASGKTVGPLILEVTNSAGGSTPRALGASTAAASRVSVEFDRDVAPAGGSPGSLDASLWTITPVGGEPMAAALAVVIDNTVWLRHVSTPAGTALTVTYTPGGGDGDVADRASRQNRIAGLTLPVDDMIPPTFAARTHSMTATVVVFDRPVYGGTSVTEWAVGGVTVVGVSTLDDGAVPSTGSSTAVLEPGTTRIALQHSRISSDARPVVSYSPALGGEILAGSPMVGGSITANDGIAPSVVAAAFTNPRTLHVELDEPPGAGATVVGALTVAGSSGNVGVDKASITPRSTTITLTLSANAVSGEHIVTAGGSVTDAAGNAVSSGARSIVVVRAPAANGSPSFEARTSSPTSTVVTFTPAVSGSTSAAAWSVSGVAATGIARVGGTAVADPGAPSVALPSGTTSVTLQHAPLYGNAAEPIVRYHGTGIASGSESLGSRAEKATDGIEPRLVSAVFVGTAFVRLSFDESVVFVEGSEVERSSHWTVVAVSGGDPTTVRAEILPDASDSSALLLRLGMSVGSGRVSYDGTGGEAGAVVDVSGNGLAGFSDVFVIDELPSPCLIPPRVGGNLRVEFCQTGTVLSGDIPAFVFVGEDGARIGTYVFHPFGDRVDVSIEPPLIVGQRYTMYSPEYVYDSGDTLGGENSVMFTFGVSDSAPPTVESARFAGPSEVRVEFSEPLRAVPTGAAFSVTPAGGTAIPLADGGVSHAACLRAVTLSLSTEASPGVHEVRAPATVTDLAGNAYATPDTPVPVTYDAIAPTAMSVTFTGERTVSLTVSEAINAATANLIRVRGLGATSASYAAGSTTVTLHTQLAAAAGSSYAVAIPAGVTDINGVPLAPTVLWAARSDTVAPAAIGARTTSPTTTEVDFGEAVRLGDSPTAQQHAAHWTVTEGAAARAVTGAEVVRGGLSVRLTHAPVGASAMPSVSYVAGASHDDASVRDWAAAPNYMTSTTMDVAAGDGLPPSIDSLTMSVLRPGEAGALGRVWARAGDMVKFVMSMSEAAGAGDPVIRLAGAPHNMVASGGSRVAWTHSHTVGMNAEQGTLAFVVSAADGGGNLAHAVVPTSGAAVMVDTVLPSFTARTLGAGTVEVTLSEPVRGTITASEWTVGGAAATGVAASTGSAPREAATLDAGARFVLWHAGASTGTTPAVAYSPPAPA